MALLILEESAAVWSRDPFAEPSQERPDSQLLKTVSKADPPQSSTTEAVSPEPVARLALGTSF